MEELKYDPQALAQVCRARGVRKVLLFGSRVRGDARPDSDVDLIVDYNPASGMTMFKFMDLEEELARLFHGLKVDVISSRGISPYIKDSLLRTTRVLYEQ
jgi:uncharacterized protein